MSAPSGSVSDPGILRTARRLRALSFTLEAGLYAVVAGSVAAFGSVHDWAYVSLWLSALGLVVVYAEWLRVARLLRGRVGACRVAFHPSGLWLVLDERSPYGLEGWGLDLGRPFWPRAPLLLPGVLFASWAACQLLLVTAAAADTLRGLAFLLTALALHVVAAVVCQVLDARHRFFRFLPALGVALSVVALLQQAAGVRRIYGFFAPLESGGEVIFGPFANRNHFAGYMLMVVPLSLGLLAEAWRRFSRRLGSRPNLRRLVVALAGGDGVAVLLRSVPALICTGALLASGSRGALVGLVLGILFAAALEAGRRARGYWAAVVLVSAVALVWMPLEYVGERFSRLFDDRAGRVSVWRDTVSRMSLTGWLTGTGFNTFAPAMSRISAWRLPGGATPWSDPVETSIIRAGRVGYRSPEGTRGMGWYREAHCDYLQLAVETGIPGLLLGLWAAARALLFARRSPWVRAALAAVLFHAAVDFSLQIPAVTVLFATLAAAAKGERGGGRSAEPT